MNYILAKTEDLDAQGYPYKYAERIPDGRVILPISAIKVLSNFAPTIIDGDKLKALIAEQKAALTTADTVTESTSGTTTEEVATETATTNE